MSRGLDPVASARKELEEETGYTGSVVLYPAFVFRSGTFRYHNYIGVVSKEFSFSPKFEYSWETDFIDWMTYEDTLDEMKKSPGDFHPGLIQLFHQSRGLIERILTNSKKLSGPSPEV